jgi:WD40 repeat protein
MRCLARRPFTPRWIARVLVHTLLLPAIVGAREAGPEEGAGPPGVRFRMAARREGPREFPGREAARAVCAARFSADGGRLMTSTHDRVVVWAVPAMRVLAELRVGATPVELADLSSDGRRVLACDAAGTLRVWDVGVAEAVRWSARHDGGFAAASFSPDGGRVLLVREGERSAVLVDAATGEPALSVTDDRKVRDLHVAVFDPTGATFVTVGSGGRPKVWSAGTGRRVTTLFHGVSNRLLAFSPSGDRVAHNVTGWIRVSDARTGKRLADTDPETRGDSQVANAIALAFAPDGRTFATSVEDDARVWDAATGKPLTPPLGEWGDGGTSDLSYSPDGRWLATAGRSGSVWDVTDGRRVCRIPSTALYSLFAAVAFSPAGRWLAVNFGQVVELWEYAGAGQP